MGKQSFESYLDIALEASGKASKYLVNNFGGVKKYTHKSRFHIGIKEDVYANDIYESSLQKLSPEIRIFSEEGSRILSDDLSWIVDPLEGTSNYMVGNHYWATQICLVNTEEPLVSVIRIPVLNQVFTAIKGKGAYLNGSKIGASKTLDLNMALLCTDKGHNRKDMVWLGKVLNRLLPKVRTFRHFGSCGIELAYTATGMIDVFINKGSFIYDFAPGALLVNEAGGKTTNLSGGPWALKDCEIVASNGKIHKQIPKVLY